MQEQVMRQLLFGVDVPGRLARMESVERVPIGHRDLHQWFGTRRGSRRLLATLSIRLDLEVVEVGRVRSYGCLGESVFPAIRFRGDA